MANLFIASEILEMNVIEERTAPSFTKPLPTRRPTFAEKGGR